MARLPRLVIPGQAHYVMLAGNAGSSLFVQRADHEEMLNFIYEQCLREEVALHGYCLLDKQIHLLLTPSSEEGLSRMIQGVGRLYVRFFNNRYNRVGTLWAGRYKSSVVQSTHWVTNCLIYFDYLPARNHTNNFSVESVSFSLDYEWSSHTHFVGQRLNANIKAPTDIWSLGNTPFAREVKYAQLAQNGLSPAVIDQITTAINGSWVLGDLAFLEQIQALTHRRVAKARPGRPPRA